MDQLVCPECSGEVTESIVDRGSLCARCASCGTKLLATSFIALSRSSQTVLAYIDPGPGKAPAASALVASGPLYQVHDAIAKTAADGTAILLIWQA